MVFFVFVLWMVLGAVGVRPRADFEALEERRKKAHDCSQEADLRPMSLASSRSPAERESLVCRVVREWDERSVKGRPRGASSEALAGPAEASRHRARKGPTPHTVPTDLWTLRRVGEVIERRRGSPITQACMEGAARAVGLERQRPARRAVERDDEAIARW